MDSSELTGNIKCDHAHTIPGYWVDRPGFDKEEYDAGGYEYEESEWVPGYSKGTYIDISLHQYKCTQCGQVFDY